MRTKKPSEKFSLGLQGRVVTKIMDAVITEAIIALSKTNRARRRRLVKRGVRPEVLYLRDTIINEFRHRASHGYNDLYFLLLGDYPRDTAERASLFKETEALLKEDGLEGDFNLGASWSETEGIGYRARFKWA